MKHGLLAVLVCVVMLAGVVVADDGNGGRPLSAALNGANEVPSGSGDPDGSGSAHLTLNQGQGEVCFDIEVSGIATVVAAHIHVAPAGVNGPVVLDFKPALNGLSGCINGVDKDLIKAIRQNPEGYYVNVHTTEFRAGAVRGQLAR